MNQPVLLVSKWPGPTRAKFNRSFQHYFSVHLSNFFKARIGKVEDDTNAFRTAIDAFGQDDEVRWETI